MPKTTTTTCHRTCHFKKTFKTKHQCQQTTTWLLINSELCTLVLASLMELKMTSLTSRVSIQFMQDCSTSRRTSPPRPSIVCWMKHAGYNCSHRNYGLPTSRDQHAAGLLHHSAQHQDQSRDKHCRCESYLNQATLRTQIKEELRTTDAPSVLAID
jgi:hypothetical protein